MADSFQPKFVDLVRNFTTTVGSGNIVLGEPVPGFTGFATALQPGDSFYYCITGLDNTSESEVGRGTLRPDGTIARDPIGGVKTSFSGGTKTVALVAAAEWFRSIESVRGAPASASTRDALADLDTGGAALLTESGREGLFLFDPADRSSEVAADSAGGLYIAPASDPSGVSGAWIRSFDGPVNPEWFGVVRGSSSGGNAAGNDAAWSAMIDCLDGLAVNMVASIHRSLHDVRFGLGTYEFSRPIELNKGTINISGRGSGHGETQSSAATRLKFYGCTGFLIQATNTSGTATRDPTSHPHAMRTVLRDFALEGNYSGAEAEHHGIHARAQFSAFGINIRNFAGDGFRIEADTVAMGGNACVFYIADPYVLLCRNGIFVDGNNANAGSVLGGTINSNRHWGIWDSSFLGNTYTGVEIANNGIVGANDGNAIGASVVSHGGNRYFAIAGQEAGASTNPPSGTTADNGWWAHMWSGGPAPGIPAWTSGMNVRAGGCIRDDNLSSKSVYTGCYVEQGQGKAQIVQGSVVVGGLLSAWIYQNPVPNQGTAVITGGTSGSVDSLSCFHALTGTVSAKLGEVGGNGSNVVLHGSHPSVSPNGHQILLHSSMNALLLTYGRGTSPSAYSLYVSGPGTSDQFGTGAVQPHTLYAPRLSIGDAAHNKANARRVFIDTAAPGSGEHGQGEWVLYRGATANLIGFNCLAAGAPGTWQSLYGLTQLKAAGSGLTVGASDQLLGRSSAGSGAVEEISCTSAGRALLAGPDAAAQRGVLGLKRALSFHCAGAPGDGEVIGGGISPYAVTISDGASACRALVAATAATTLAVKNNGTQIGSISFAAGSTTATFALTNGAIAAGDQITVHGPSPADATLADIDGLLAE